MRKIIFGLVALAAVAGAGAALTLHGADQREDPPIAIDGAEVTTAEFRYFADNYGVTDEDIAAADAENPEGNEDGFN